MLFLQQFSALFVKNWVVLTRHPVVNLLRCLIMPIACGIFLAYAQVFLAKPNNNGLGTRASIASLADTFDGSLQLLWSDNTGGTGSPTPAELMSRVTRGFSEKQHNSVLQVDPGQIGRICQQNFIGVSDCFASVTFEATSALASNTSLNYTVSADQHLYFIDVQHHTSDFELRILPLQWAIESAFVELDTGVPLATPQEWPFTQATNSQQVVGIRLGYVSFVQALLVIAFFVCYIGISYHLPAAATAERAGGLSSHMKAMGLLDSARVISWHISLSLAYLPAWLVIAAVWHVKVFTGTNAGLLIVIHLLLGLSLASWSMFVMAPFGKSPQLAAIVSTILALVWVVIGMAFSGVSTFIAFIITIFFPPFFYPIAIRCISGFEIHLIPTSATLADPEHNLVLWPLLLASAITIFLWPWLGALLERRLYDARNPSRGCGCCGRRRKTQDHAEHDIPPNVAISIRHLEKVFYSSMFKGKKGNVTAIADLSLDIPKHGIFVLLGPNGAGKSTVMSILGGLMGRTRGTILFEGGVERPPLGSIGLVPQNNVLFPELTCYQTLWLWKAIKPHHDETDVREDLIQLLQDCDLGDKIHYNAESLSGGQKRKLQLAIGLVGGSKVVLVDECTSGVDPLSRRSIWKTLSVVKDNRTIVFTTHFLDEADLLADEIAVLAAPGKLVAHGNPVMLKSTLGDGYTMKVVHATSSKKLEYPDPTILLGLIRDFSPGAHASTGGGINEVSYHLKTADPLLVGQILEQVERERNGLRIDSYSISAASIEDIFLGLMQDAESKYTGDVVEEEKLEVSTPELSELAPGTAPVPLRLSRGTRRSLLGQACTIFHKRVLIARRSFLSPILAMLVLLVASCVPLRYLPKDGQTCVVSTFDYPPSPIYISSYLKYAFGGFSGNAVLATPPGLLDALGNNTISALSTRNITENIPDNATFIDTVDRKYQFLEYGGLSVDLQSGASLFAWDAQSPTTGMMFLNTVSNLLYNKALNDTGRTPATPKILIPHYGSFPEISAGNLNPLKWAAFYGAAMAVFPAFFTLYVAQERRSSVQAMQFSNGLSNPAGLWLGHLMFDSLFSIISATILVIVFAAKSTLFHGLGYLWFIMVLHGMTGTLFAYCVSVIITSPVAAFASLAAYQIIVYAIYLAGYLLAFTYAKASEFSRDMNIIHFTMSLLSPTPNVVRAGFISVNLFSLLCKGEETVSASALGSITRYGGPILYLILYGVLLFLILVWVDSGSAWKQALPARLKHRRRPSTVPSALPPPDVQKEAEAVLHSTNPLSVMDVSKAFGSNKVVESVSFGVANDTIFALLGPNGAGKTTTFNMIRGDIRPDQGDVVINGHSIIRHTQLARHSLGVCPQFTAIDSQLTVREHLHIYARLKGLRRKEVARDVDAIMHATGLAVYADRLANKLSGGNQRKLALAIALIGNPSVVLIDEFSTGVDAKMKRDMWTTLKNVAVGKAIVITTHSMEEASTLANKVGILAKRMLAVDTTKSLVERYASYLVHFPCRTREDVVRAQEIMARIPGACMADDVATRFEVPVTLEKNGGGISLALLFAVLAESGASDYAVEKASLESVFMKVIRENQVREGDGEARIVDQRKWWRTC
ncbi:P-loop containing nucleoside triphosphate hydrolase protein [Cubamyces sp. BRFM 1775]|nr:P-loop containing nucleoside triphosphate hydrolase protein [Cubamyces sp. BRFM 1775]